MGHDYTGSGPDPRRPKPHGDSTALILDGGGFNQQEGRIQPPVNPRELK